MNQCRLTIRNIDNTLISISQLQIPGTSIVERCEINGNFSSLSKIDRAVFEKNQSAINEKIKEYARTAKDYDNPGKKLKNLLIAVSFLPQSVTPFDIENKAAVVYLQNQISEILDSVESSYEIVKNHKLNDKKQIIVRMLINQKPLTSIPILFETTSLKCNGNGFYYLDYDDFCDGNPFYLKWKIDRNSLSFPELNKYELKDAVKLIKNIGGSSNQIYINPPVELFAQIEANCFIDDEQMSNAKVVNAIKKVLLQNKISVANHQKEANMKIEADVNASFSSENEYLGFCYKTNATITITGDGMDRKVIVLDDIDSDESTKSFDKNKIKASKNSLKMMIKFIEQELTKYLQSI